MRKYTITLNEEQMLLISRCIEDISRFLGGDADLFHTVSTLKNWKEIQARLRNAEPLIAPELNQNANYGWNGGDCPNEHQRKLIAKTYYLYREMLHQYNLANNIHNVYSSPTIRCADSGEPITITWEDEE